MEIFPYFPIYSNTFMTKKQNAQSPENTKTKNCFTFFACLFIFGVLLFFESAFLLKWSIPLVCALIAFFSIS